MYITVIAIIILLQLVFHMKNHEIKRGHKWLFS
jgi:hypothetical protein